MSDPCPRSELTNGGHTWQIDPGAPAGLRCSRCGTPRQPVPETITWPVVGDPFSRDEEIRKLRDEVEIWRKNWAEAAALEHKAVKRGNRLAEVLKELVTLKAAKDSGFTTGVSEVEYQARKTLAWHYARAALREAGIES